MSEITVRGDVDERAVQQLQRCARAGEAPRAALCADGHVGYSQPIGGVVAYRDKISPSGVGYDIGCGNKAVRTNIRLSDIVSEAGERRQAQSGLRADEPLEGAHKNEASLHAYSSGLRQNAAIAGIMDEIVRRISFGVGRVNNERVDHPVLDEIAHAVFEPQRGLAQSAAAQLGTVGAGNHYVDLFYDETGVVWVGVHFGSRGFGHRTASGFLSLAAGGKFDERVAEGEMDSPPVLLDTHSGLGQAYIEAMTLAGRYAYAGRDVVVEQVLDILGATAVEEVHNHHNYAWLEEHDGESLWVIRKGATPAWPGQKGFVGATMGENSVILEGIESTAGPSLLYSTIHGAGRAMSRTQAAGKMGNRAVCNERDCDYWVSWKHYRHERQQMGRQDDRIPFTLCPDHPAGTMLKCRGRIKPGLIDYAEVQRKLAIEQIELRGGAADEAPAAYKRLNSVLAYHTDTIYVLRSLTPIGVAMAGPDTYDPWKD